MDAELYQPFKLYFQIFKAGGMWQDGNQSWMYFAYGHLVQLIFVELYIVGEFLYIYNAKDFVDFIQATILIPTFVAQLLKTINFFVKLRTIKQSFENLKSLLELSAPESFPHRERVRKEVAKGFKIFKAYYGLALMTCITGAVVSYEVTFALHQLPYKLWFPFDTETSKIGFEVARLYLVLTPFVVSIFDATLDILPVVFMTFAIGLVKELSDRLAEVGKIKEVGGKGSTKRQQATPADAEVELIKCIEIHQRILEYVAEIKHNFSAAIFMQGFMSSLTLCTCAFTMSVVSFSLLKQNLFIII